MSSSSKVRSSALGDCPGRCASAAKRGSLISLWSVNFHHWLLDALPRLGVLEQAGRGNVPLVVPKRLLRFQRESLALLGVDKSRLVPYRGNHVAPDIAVWPSPAAHIGNPDPEGRRMAPREALPRRRATRSDGSTSAERTSRRLTCDGES